MAQRHDITTITFQANARGANAAIEALRQEAERCNLVVTDLKAKLKDGIKMGKSTDELDKIRADLKTADKEAKQWSKAYNELIKGMRVLDQGIKAFNDGTLNQMSAAFQKTLYNAAKLTRTKLAPDSKSFREDFKQLTALMDAAQQNFAKLQGDAASMIKTLKEGGKVSVSALREEVNAQKELLSVLSETDKGYKTTQKNVAVLESYLRAMGGDYEFVRQNITDTQKVSDEMLRNMYTELQKTNAEGKVTKDIMRENARAMKEIRAEQARRVENVLGGDLTKQSEGSIRNAINNAKELLLTYKTGSKEAQALSAQIVNAEEHLKTHGTEAARAAQKQAEAMKLLDDKYKMMQGRMGDLTKLSKSALDETQKFWQAQMDGATKGSRAYKEAERNLKAIAAEQEKQATAQLKAAAGKISRKNLTGMSEQEIQASIAAAKQLAASMKPTDTAYKQLQQDIIRAEEHVKQFGLEAERSSQKAAQQMQVMNDRMGKLKSLSAAALEETKRYWQAQMDGATRGSQAYKQAEANVKALTAEQERLNAAQLKADAKSIYGNKATMSEGAIRKAIEAARQYQQTLAATDPEYKRLTKAILDAEEHIKKYGIEAERAARKEIEAAKKAADERKKTDKMMHDQLKQGTALSDSALKAQQQYWQRLIDDPKTAATSLKKYEAELQKVKQIQDQLVQNRGKDALAFFRGDTSNASASQIQEQAKALKAYRDSLPQKTHATTIAEIDEILKKVGMTAQKAAAETMSFKQAMQVSAQAGKGQFKGTVEQLTQAKKVLEEMSAKAVKGGLAWRRMQEALQRIELELKNVGHLSKEVQAVLDAPKGKSFNALKQAVEQGRAALNNMDRTTKEGQLQFDLLAKKIKAADFELKQLAGTAKGSASAFDKAWSRLKTYITLYMGAAVAIQKITATMGDLMELSDKMGEVRKTTNLSAEAVAQLSRNLAKLDVRTSLTDLMAISASAGQLGLKSVEDIQGFTVAANKLMIALPEMGKEAATEMMRVAIATGEVNKIRQQLQEGVLEGSSATAVAMEKIGSTIDRLRASSASTAPEITDFVKRLGAVGAQSGISIDQVAALGSTISSLGMRVEMSATALSRMIPAIKNNAFAIANAIGVAPEALRSLFEAGRGMEAILMIFQHLKEQNANADTIESLLGIGNMKDVMKQLNQQGARAGIVFAGLSQNVDELRKQLVIANEAYEENVAITNEFNRMNDTTAARWERFKNTLEEMFVGDSNQRLLGGLIDGLHDLLKLIADTGPIATALKALTVTWIALKIGVGDGLKALALWFWNLSTNMTKAATAMKAFGKANWVGALLTALTYLAFRFYEWANSIDIVANEMAKANEEIMKQTGAVDTLFRKLAKLREQERVAAISAAETAKAEAEKAKAMEQAADASEDYLKKISLIDQLEKQQADTEEFLMGNLKEKTAATKEDTKATEEHIKTEKEAQKQSELIRQLEQRRAENMEQLNQQHLQEVTVIGDRTKAEKKLMEQNQLIAQLDERRAEIMEQLNMRHLDEVVVVGERAKSTKALQKQLTLIEQLEANRASIMEQLNMQHLQEVVVIGDKTKATKKLQEQSELITQLEQNRAAVMEILNQRHLDEVVVIGDKTKATKNLQQQSELITQLEKNRAEIMEQLNTQHLQEVVVLGKRKQAEEVLVKQSELITKLETRRAETAEFLNQVHLQEVVVIGDRTKATKNLMTQFNLIEQLEANRVDILEQLNQQHLQEVVVIGDKTKAMQGLQQQSALVAQLDQQRTELMEILNQKHLDEVVVIGKRKQAEESVAKQSALVQMLEKQQAEVTDVLTFKTKDLSAETEELSKKEEKVAEQATKVEDGMHRVNIEGSKSASIIREINSKYGTYLGYMISETSSAQQLAAARELINKKLRETITLKQQEAAMGSVEQEYGGKVNKKGSAMDKTIDSLFGNNYEAAARVSVAISEAAQKYTKNTEEYEKAVRKIVSDNFKYIDRNSQIAKQFSDDVVQDRLTSKIVNAAKDYREAVEEYQYESDVVNRRFEATNNVNRKKTREAVNKDLNAILADWKDIVDQYRKAEGEEKEKLAAEVYKQQRSYINAVANNADYFENDKRKDMFDKNIANMKTYEKGLRSVAGEAIRTIDAMERAEGKITGIDLSNDGESNKNPWGGGHDAASTDWKNMTANQLVERRKQMKDFVNAIQTDTDVQSVLKEDAALKKAIENGMSSDMRTVIEWYNTERLKIQDELHARHLTNTGDWMDPKKQRGAHKQFRDEMDAYLHELDAYYTERKTRIEEAGTDEGLTEAEIKNRTLNNEMEWQQRRAELQKLYSRKQKEVTEEELNAIYHIIAERTGDSEKFVKAQIAKTNQFVDSIEKSGEKGAAIVHRWMSQVELDTERSYLKGQQALTKQMRAIEAIIDKERPFNGITKSLQENLATMDILTGYMRKEYNELMKQGADMTKFNEWQRLEELKNTTFMLGEAENAYSTTIDHVMDDMRQNGMTAWADWLSADPKLQEALMAQLRSTYDSIQDAIKKEASQLKKQAEIMWNNILMPDGKTTLKDAADRAIAQLSLNEGRVSRANSLIGAGQASERVADKLAIKQMQLQLTMQEHYYNLMKLRGQAAVDMLNAQAKAARERGDYEEATRKELDAQHAQMSLNLATAKEETELAKQREEIIARTEDSQNRLYTSLREWADLLASSLQGVFEASHAGDAEYYNELAKMRLTGKGGPGAGTYIVIDNEGTEDAEAHYEYLSEREALERQHEIERENAQAEAWRKVWDDINNKIAESITDWANAYLQNKATEDNTAELKSLQGKLGEQQATLNMSINAENQNTAALNTLTGKLSEGISVKLTPDDAGGSEFAADKANGYPSSADIKETPSNIDFASDKQANYPSGDQANTDATIANTQALNTMTQAMGGQVPESADITGDFASDKQMNYPSGGGEIFPAAQQKIDEQNAVTENAIKNKQKEGQVSVQTDQKIAKSNQSTFAKMIQATNLYGVAYAAMSNDNMDMAQKFEMVALQAVGNAAIAGLQVALSSSTAETAANLPPAAAKSTAQAGPIVGPILFAALSALVGGLMGLAASKIAKSKSQIAQVTGASVGAGRLATGMLTYAEGNVNEFSDPNSLTPGRHYNVDGADGKTYRAKYMGEGAKTHITSGPEFHLVGEKGREAIIDAHTTRNIQLNEPEIWGAIKTLYNGGSLRHTSTRRGRGVRAFADGNLDDFEKVESTLGTGSASFDPEMLVGFQQSLDRNSAIMEQIAANGIEAFVSPYGPRGVVAGYDKAKKEAMRHGEKYL